MINSKMIRISLLIILATFVMPTFGLNIAPQQSITKTTTTTTTNSTGIETFVTQTTGIVTTSSSTAIAQCTNLQLSGSIIMKTSGSIALTCISTGAINFPTTTSETPIFTLPSGFMNASIQLASTINQGCTQNMIQIVRIGQLITSNTPISFVPAGTNSTSTLSSGTYDYCLWYNNPPSIFSFTISWTP